MPTNDWTRLTFTVAYAGDYSECYFKVQVDGDAPYSYANGYSGVTGNGSPNGGTWLMCANMPQLVRNWLASVSFNSSSDMAISLFGITEVDDLVVSDSPPPSLTTPIIHNAAGASGVTANSAILNGKVVSTGDAPAHVYVCWGTNSAGPVTGDWDAVESLGVLPNGTFSTNLTSLLPETSYYYRCYATNVHGISWAPNAQRLLTLPAIGIAEMSVSYGDVEITDGADSPVASNGTHFGSSPIAGGLVDHIFVITNSGGTDLLLTGAPPVSVSGTQASDFTVVVPPATNIVGGGFSPFTVRFNPSGTGLRSAVLSMTNNDYVLAGDLYNFSIAGKGIEPPEITNDGGASNIIGRLATLNGNLVATGAAPTEVYVFWGTNDGGAAVGTWGTNEYFGIRTEGSIATNITGLLPSTTYYYRFYATNAAGECWAAGTASFDTPPGVIIPYSNSFETYSAGYAISNDVCWDAGSTTYVTNSPDHGVDSPYFPAETHSKVLQLDGPATNWFAKDNTLDFVYVDVLIKPESLGMAPAQIDGPQVLAYVNNDQHIVFRHAYYEGGATPGGYVHTWATNDQIVVPTNDWTRLTFTVAYAGDYSECYFRVQVDGDAPYSSANGYPGVTGNNKPGGGSWFMCANMPQFVRNWLGAVSFNASASNAVSLFGIKEIDDLVVSDLLPPSLATPIIHNTSGASGVTANSAILNGKVVSTGDAPAHVYVCWGTNSAGSVTGDWDAVESLGVLPNGTFSTNLTSLLPETFYYYRCYATNVHGISWAPNAQRLLTLPAIGIAEMSVSYGDVEITDGADSPVVSNGTHFGSSLIAGGLVEHVFVITNSGGTDLLLTGVPPVFVSGTHASDFTVVVPPATNISAGGFATFTVRFDPSSSGLRYADLSIENNDYWLAGAPYNFSIAGNGMAPPEITNDGGASDILTRSAVLNGNLVATGAAPTEVYVFWGTNDGGAAIGTWGTNEYFGIRTEGAIATNITGLLPDTTHYYRFYATNAAGEYWSQPTTNFITALALVHYSNSFEAYSAGYTISNDVGWKAASTTYVTNSPDHGVNSPYFPGETHSKVLQLDGPATNWFAKDDTLDFVYVDILIKPEALAAPPELSEPNPQLPAYVNSDQHLVFRHAYYDGGMGPGGYAHTWATNDQITVPTNDWTRLTFTVAYAGYYNECYFMVQVDGDAPYSYANGYPGVTGNNKPGGGTWFMGANMPQLVRNWLAAVSFNASASNAVSLFGIKEIDDLVVSDSPPPLQTTPTIHNATGAASISTNSATVRGKLVSAGSAPAQVYVCWGTNHAGAVTGNWDEVESMGGLPNGVFPTDLTGLSPGTRYYYRCYATNDYGESWAPNALRFETPPLPSWRTSRGTPYQWLVLHGLVSDGALSAEYEAADLYDDGDGMLAWEEYRAGTDPQDAMSAFGIISITPDHRITWFGGTNLDNYPFAVWRSTNLLNEADWTLYTNLDRTATAIASGNMTNEWRDDDATSNVNPILFYRVASPTNSTP